MTDASPFTPEQQEILRAADEVAQEFDRSDRVLNDPARWAIVVRAVRIIREHALETTGANNCGSPSYKRAFRQHMEKHAFGTYVKKKADLNAIHWLGKDDRIGRFLEWWERLEDGKREKWNTFQTLVRHFREQLEGKTHEDPRTKAEIEIEVVQTECGKIVAANRAERDQARAERDQARHELAAKRTMLKLAITKFGPDAVRAVLDDLTRAP